MRMQRTFPTNLPAQLSMVLVVCMAAGTSRTVIAGGGPENVFLVVNRDSPGSMTIANHYIQLRHVPAANVLSLPWNVNAVTTDVGTFRKRILTPVLAAIEKRRLKSQIDYIVYSSDFPSGIDLQADVTKFHAAMQKATPPDSRNSPGERKWPQYLTKVASINGLTYLWQPVLVTNPGYLFGSNRYMRLGFLSQSGAAPGQEDAPTLGFRADQQFGSRGELVDSGGRSYMLSTMLAVTTQRGNTISEVLDYLRRSAAADGTHPRGTIYFCQTDTDVRSRVRSKMFPAAVEELGKLGVAAEIVKGKLPVKKNDVQGAMTGTAAFNWKSSGSTILPGAICEHLTSFGGVMQKASGQTSLSEFLRHGASGACGAVTEPFVIEALKFQPKFPVPMIHVHYARGCTLAEAFYQSVHGPYQLLIVGDPLCRPWANIPRVTVEGVPTGASVKGTLTLKPSATFARDSKVDHFELFIDGWRRTVCQPGETFQWDTARLADGYHEFRVVAVEAGLIRSQGRKIFPVVTANRGRKITVSIAPRRTVDADRKLYIKVDSPGSIAIAVMHNSRVVGKIAGESGRIEIDPSTLGYGPVRLSVVGLGQGGPADCALARPRDGTGGG